MKIRRARCDFHLVAVIERTLIIRFTSAAFRTVASLYSVRSRPINQVVPAVTPACHLRPAVLI